MNIRIASSLLIILVVGLSSSCSAQVAERISTESFNEKINSDSGVFKILDIRTDEEVAEGMVPGAEQLDFYADDFTDKLKQLEKDVTYYIYCRSGGRSGKALSSMSELGFKKVYELEGGMNAWKAEGRPTE